MGNEQVCKDLAARLKDAKERIKEYEEELKNPDLPSEDRQRAQGMRDFYKNYADAIEKEIAKWCT